MLRRALGEYYSTVVTKLTQKTVHIDETPINIGAGEGNRSLAAQKITLVFTA